MNHSMGYDLLTGCTGLLGGYLMREALRSGRRVAVLVRPTKTHSARQRVDQLLARFGLEASPTILEGDLRRPHFGLSTSDLEWVASHCDRLVHSGAVVSFEVDHHSEPYATNVDGTRYALELCRRTGLRAFHFVSTAYVCGQGDQPFGEDDFEVGQQFSNAYERSKFLAELLIRQADFLDQRVIYRPSVIVGDSATGYTSAYHGVYVPMRFAWAQGLGTEATLAALGMQPDETFNLVPVDWVARIFWRLAEVTGPGLAVYHLTHSEPVSLGALMEAVGAAPPNPVKVEPGAQDSLRTYAPYFRQHRPFLAERTRQAAPELPCPPLDEQVLARLARFAAENHFGQLPGLGLEVAEPDGETTWVTPPGETHAFCNRATLERLVSGDLSLESALYAGRLVLEARPDQLSSATLSLQHLLGSLGHQEVGA
ncbi:MAG: SDR family oxidoreductase [Candidatus Eremiobacteraeota bacterium]|nr:SDR family oxidoreductase [Candidatus Eremiobacteraeota bacterium]